MTKVTKQPVTPNSPTILMALLTPDPDLITNLTSPPDKQLPFYLHILSLSLEFPSLLHPLCIPFPVLVSLVSQGQEVILI